MITYYLYDDATDREIDLTPWLTHVMYNPNAQVYHMTFVDEIPFGVELLSLINTYQNGRYAHSAILMAVHYE